MKPSFKIQATDGWLISFTDLLFLLITFFVLQISMSHLPSTISASPIEIVEPLKELAQQQLSPPAIQSVIDTVTQDSNVSSIYSNGQLYLNLPNIMFVKTTGQLSFTGEELVRNLGLSLKDKNYKILVHVLSDSLESEFYLEHSKWRLTEQRAASIWRQLIDAGVEKSLISLSVGLNNAVNSSLIDTDLIGAQLIFSFIPEDLEQIEAVKSKENDELIESSQRTEQFFLDL
jgi:flagellar motor protein MotB